MDSIKKLFKYIWLETKQGNFIPIGITIYLYLFHIQPFVIKTIDDIYLNRQVNTEIGIRMNEMYERMENLEKKTNADFTKRKPGKLSTTGF